MRLLDTTVAIDHLRGMGPARDLFRALIEANEPIGASEVVRFELLAGCRRDELELLEDFCATLMWIPVDEAAARSAGALARTYRAAFAAIDGVDYLIAATALLLDAELLTTNVKHFPMLEGLAPAY